MQKRIKTLPPHLANQIAAGEVIERPLSVIKELIENSIDAGATQIQIDIENGGMSLIRVTDNGHGIVKADLPLTIERHATSKIQASEDLFAIQTLGFRGEALASMSSIAHLRIASKAQGSDTAWAIQSSMSSHPTVQPAAHPPGTTIEIKDLFYNVPARRKFLKSAKTEWQHIVDVFKRFVLSHPEIGFVIKHNGKRYATYAPAETARQIDSRVKAICQAAFLKNANYIDVSYDDHILLKGWVGLEGAARRYADQQYFFLNGRYIRDKLINHAIKEAYSETLALTGLYPSYVLYLEVHAETLDVNVHPTKHEVRFQKATLIHDFIAKCLKTALSQEVTQTQQIGPRLEIPRGPTKLSTPMSALAVQDDTSQSPVLSNLLQTQNISAARNLQRYYVVELKDQVAVVDMQAALHLILQAYLEKSDSPRNMPLLIPQPLPPMTSLSSQKQQFFKSAGFVFQAQSDNLIVTHIPFYIRAQAVNTILASVNTERELLAFAEMMVLEKISQDEMDALLRELLTSSVKGPWLLIEKTKIQGQFRPEFSVAD